jgi:outer membrane immunogenic protein
VAWQHFSATENCAVLACGPGVNPPGAPYSQTNDTTRTGWTVGGGIEKMLSDRWLIRGEYRYADYGTWTSTFGGTPIIVKSFDLATHTAFVGFAKKF